MAIVARCPYCRKGKVRAPDHALGLSATCPRCQNCFTIVETEQAAPPPRHTYRPAAAVAAPAAPAPVQAAVAEDVGIQLHHVEESQPTSEAPEYIPEPVERPIQVPVKPTEPSLPPGLIALASAGLALTLSQTPLAHWGGAAFALLGVAVAGFALSQVRRRWLVPASAAGLNVLVLLLVVATPSWLGLGPWRTPTEVDDASIVKAVGADGVATPAGEWVDTTHAAWQRGPVRVSVGRNFVGPIELTGPDGKKTLSREQYLHVRLRVKNAGVSGEVEFKGWPSSSVQLTDSSGNIVAAKVFDAGQEPPGRIQPAVLGPGQSAEGVLFFEAVPTTIKHLRLKLAGEAFDSPEPVRLHIPWLLVQFKPAP